MNKGCVAIWRALIVGGNANNGSNAGLSYANSNNAASNANANIGSQLCCTNFVATNPASWQKITLKSHVLVGNRKLVMNTANQ